MTLTRRSFMSRSAFTEKPPTASSRRWLIRQLDIWTSMIVRRRDQMCVTCGARQSLQCSHFYSRRYLNIRFDLRNCNAMCVECNRRHNLDPRPYLAYMEAHYGPEVVAELRELKMSLQKVSDEELRRLLEEYEA